MIASGYPAIDEVLGGVRSGFLYLVSAPPGMGKTTLLRHLSVSLAKQGFHIAFLSAEESQEHIDAEFRRIHGGEIDQLPIDVRIIRSSIDVVNPILQAEHDIIVLDSFQAFAAISEGNTSPSIYKQAAIGKRLFEIVRRKGLTLFMIAQVTKSGRAAGPNSLAHDVDAVVELRADALGDVEIYVRKNRGGSAMQTVSLRMTAKGLIRKHPEELGFIQMHPDSVVGCVAAPVILRDRMVIDELKAVRIGDHDERRQS
ncbi:hypothetical protein MASR2M78_28860 [Treponema sp.]